MDILQNGQRDSALVQIKGVRDGLLISVDDSPSLAVPDLIESELVDKKEFLAGGRIALETGYRSLDRNTVADLQALCEQHGLTLWAVLTQDESSRDVVRDLGLATRISGAGTDLNGDELPAGEALPAENFSERPLPAAEALFLRETIRSGRSIYYEGDIVILGDVNAGAEIAAGGNVIVWGKLRGLVHAGIGQAETADPSAVICALELTPTQLRIGERIAVDPDNGRGKEGPEEAAVIDGRIVARPWR